MHGDILDFGAFKGAPPKGGMKYKNAPDKAPYVCSQQ